jgi:hypothetical protein
MPAANPLADLLTDHEWNAVRYYVNTPKATMSRVAETFHISRYRIEQLIAIVNVEYQRRPALRQDSDAPSANP